MDGGLATFVFSPAFVLSVLVGAFHTCIYVFVRGNLGWHIPAVLLGGIIGALLGQALGSRLGDVLRVGDYSLLWASLLAWVGIGMAIVISTLAAGPHDPDDSHGEIRPRRG
jgi:hypothetical protein